MANVPTNISPLVIPGDARIAALSAANLGNETWEGQVRVNGAETPAVTIDIINTDTAFTSVSYDLNAGDTLSTYCSGSSISRPQLYVWMVEKEP